MQEQALKEGKTDKEGGSDQQEQEGEKKEETEGEEDDDKGEERTDQIIQVRAKLILHEKREESGERVTEKERYRKDKGKLTMKRENISKRAKKT